MTRIVLVSLASFAAVTAIVLTDARLESQRQERITLDRVARHLELQRLLIDSTYQPESRFPDWDLVAGRTLPAGQCVRLDDPEGGMRRSSCVGAGPLEAAPGWFAALYRLSFPSAEPASRPIVYKGRSFGTLRVSTDPGAALAGAWREVRRMLGLTGVTLLSLCLLSWFAIERALAPTRAVVAGLDRLAGGDFAHRLPAFRHAELRRIGEVANQLAETIEATLAERARLSQRLVDAQEQERRHLARELHDEFAQNLTAVGALAASMERSADAATREEARTLSQIAQRMMASLRGTLLHLRPAELDRFGLAESLRQLVAVWNRSSPEGPRFALAPGEPVGPLPEEAAIHVFRIAQEGLTNAARHAGASQVRLGLAETAEGLRLSVEDDGGGRSHREAAPAGEPEGEPKDADGRGILNMRERVAALGGSIVFEDRAGGGLRVTVDIPRPAGREAGA